MIYSEPSSMHIKNNSKGSICTNLGVNNGIRIFSGACNIQISGRRSFKRKRASCYKQTKFNESGHAIVFMVAGVH